MVLPDKTPVATGILRVGPPVGSFALMATLFGYTDVVDHKPMLGFAGTLATSSALTLVQLRLNDRARRGLSKRAGHVASDPGGALDNGTPRTTD